MQTLQTTREAYLSFREAEGVGLRAVAPAVGFFVEFSSGNGAPRTTASDLPVSGFICEKPQRRMLFQRRRYLDLLFGLTIAAFDASRLAAAPTAGR